MTKKEFQRFERFINQKFATEVEKFRGWFHVYDEKAHIFGMTTNIITNDMKYVIVGDNIAGVPFNYIRSINFYIKPKGCDYEIHF